MLVVVVARTLFFFQPTISTISRELPPFPSRLPPATPTFDDLRLQRTGPPGRVRAAWLGAAQGKAGSPAAWLTDWQVGTQDFKR